MASCLSKAITTESKKLNSLLLQYNSIVPIDDQLSWEDVTNLSSSIWLVPQQEDNLPVPRSVRLAAIDALMKKKRAIEEQELLMVEMENILRFHLEQHASLARSISHLPSVPSVFNRGALCLLKIKQHQYEAEIKACIKFFPKLLNIPDIPFSLEPTEDCTTRYLHHPVTMTCPTMRKMETLTVCCTQGVYRTLMILVTTVSLIMLPGSPSFFSIMCFQILYQRRESVDHGAHWWPSDHSILICKYVHLFAIA